MKAMSALTSLQGILPSLDGEGNPIRDLWDRMSRLPGGTWAFSKLIGQYVPYTGSIGAHIVELERGRSRVELRDRRAVRNHLRSIHAIALANLAELAGNLALLYSLPDDARFILAGLQIDYVKKARGTLTAIGTCPTDLTSEKKEHAVVAEIFDASGELVARTTFRSLVGPKRKPDTQ